MSNILYENKIDEYFDGYDCTIVNKDKLMKYLKDNDYLYTYDEIINRFVRGSEIRCPMKYLDKQVIFDEVKGYYVDLENGVYLDDDDFDDDDGISDVIDKHLVIDNELLEHIINKYNISCEEVFKNMSKYGGETIG